MMRATAKAQGDFMLIGDIPRLNAARYGDKTAFISEAGSLSWLQLNERVNRLANAMADLGLARGARLAIAAPTSLEVVEAYFAAAKLGVVIVPLHTGLVGREISQILDDVEAAAVILAAETALAHGDAFSSSVSVRHRIAIGQVNGYLSYEGLLEQAPAHEPKAGVHPNDLLAIRFTSGTTGAPKGVPTNHQDQLLRAKNLFVHIPHSQNDRALLFAPVSLGIGSQLLFSYSYVGATIVLCKRFDAGEVLRTIERERITTFVSPVPTLFAKLLEEPAIEEVNLASLRLVGYGGGVFPTDLLLQTLQRFPCDVFGVYGSVEAGGLCTYLMPDDHRLGGCVGAELEKRLKRLRSCGREALQAEIRIVDEQGAAVPRGAVGEMLVRSDSMIGNYWRRPGEIDKVLRDGWFHTGDAGLIDEDGYIFIVDRLKDVIRTGGMNVSSVEVENVLLGHPDVTEAAAIGVPDPRWGEMLVAVVVARQPIDSETLTAHCRASLANYKVPKRIEFVQSLPRNSMGKVLKRELRTDFNSGRGANDVPESLTGK
jgi:acyl-CoA synthetase (AMP-forming)/AMP-acid ligase II